MYAWLISLTAIRRKREVREKEEGEKKNSLRLGVSLIFYLFFFFQGRRNYNIRANVREGGCSQLRFHRKNRQAILDFTRAYLR